MFCTKESVKAINSEMEAMKTNEILRRRKIRLQQVREQSKDIARLIRQRAKIEKSKHLIEIDAKKEREYLNNQAKLIRELEDQYARAIHKIGASHQSATDLTNCAEENRAPVDLSQIRGKEATAKVIKEKQEKLDAQKKRLDRQLQAREIANNKSREKSKFTLSQHPAKINNPDCKFTEKHGSEPVFTVDVAPKIDMATQCESGDVPYQDEPRIPELKVTNEEKDRNKETEFINSNNKDGGDKPKMVNIFAVSDEMPSTLRGSHSHGDTQESTRARPALTIVSEYLKQRTLRLRETDSPAVAKTRDKAELQSIKQTLLKTRTAAMEGNEAFVEVHDDQVIPVPSWEPGHVPRKPITKSPYNDNSLLFSNSLIDFPESHDMCPSPVLRGPSPFRRRRLPRPLSSVDEYPRKNISSTVTSLKGSVTKRRPVTVYNHATRDTTSMSHRGGEQLVARDYAGEDAYSQAVKESNTEITTNKELDKKLQSNRNKVAMTKQNVEKEYKETMSFLNSLPKDVLSPKKPLRQAFMDDTRQQALRENRQRKMQYEFKKSTKTSVPAFQCGFEERCVDSRQDMMYSWMPASEGEQSSAAAATGGRAGRTQSVKFSAEPRGRHRHTPPTRDTCSPPRRRHRRNLHRRDTDDSDSSRDTDKTPTRRGRSTKTKQADLADAERIIIYKIIEKEKITDDGTRNESHKTTESTKSYSKVSLEGDNEDGGNNKQREDVAASYYPDKRTHKCRDKQHRSTVSYSHHPKNREADRLDEECEDTPATVHSAIIRDVRGKKKVEIPLETDPEDREDCRRGRTTPAPSTHTETRHKQATSMHDSNEADKDSQENPASEASHGKQDKKHRRDQRDRRCKCSSSAKNQQNQDPVPVMQWDCGDGRPKTSNKSICPCKKTPEKGQSPSTSTSSTSFKSVGNDDKKPSLKYPGNINMHENAGENPGDFYIGASGYLKDNAYEVVIQLRKKDSNDNVENNQEVQKQVHVDIPQFQYNNKTTEPIATIATPPNTDQSQDANSDKNITSIPEAEAKVEKTNDENKNIPVNVEAQAPEDQVKWVSTYTQTSMITPTQKPVFHMSSSTSTTYLSPPDFIRPDFLKSVGKKSRTKCKCKKCKSKKMLETDFDERSEIDADIKKDTKKRFNNITKDCELKIRSKCCQCRKCCAVTYRQESNSIKMNSRNPKKHQHKNKNLNPLIRLYIKKLLTLTDQGAKAIAKQECSSVATPGSSVINVKTNIDPRNSSPESRISLPELRKLVKRTSDVASETNNIDYFSNGDQQKTHRRQRTRVVHKVKSLNISKSFLTHKKRKRSDYKRNTSGLEAAMKSKIRNKSSPSHENITSERKRKTNKVERQADIQNTREDEMECPYDNTGRRNEMGSETNSIYSNGHSSNTRINSTQITDIDNDIHLIKIATSKYQIMEQIACQTEKCTRRVSNLAKMLKEVRKNKSLVYSQMSNTDPSLRNNQPKSDRSVSEIKTDSDVQVNLDNSTPSFKSSPDMSPISCLSKISPTYFEPVLTNINNKKEDKSTSPIMNPNSEGDNSDDIVIKLRKKPPPAIARINFRQTEDHIIPHELSTVIEVDSPMSTIQKTPGKISRSSVPTPDPSTENICNMKSPVTKEHKQKSTDIDRDNSKKDNKAEIPKGKMLDLKKFNDIMLKPFITIEEFAKQCNLANLEDPSQIEEIIRSNTAPNDDISSLHSDGSLPDVVAELMKRNVISEPFKFDSISNVNSTNDSSESSLSAFTMTKLMVQNKKTKSLKSHDKENAAETSDTLSISSNPDLENAFKKLGIGWASSTLKKTKERLALSSSSNTSCSSSQNVKLKHPDKQNNSQLASLIKQANKTMKSRLQDSNIAENQASRSKSMTIKEFLTNELSKKITFSDKSSFNDDGEFISLYDTKMPEEMKQTSQIRDDRSMDGTQTNANRARTSTPVQLYRSSTYNHSSSSSNNNISNGLFSNVDEISSVKHTHTSSSMRNNSTSDKDDLTIPNYSLKLKRDQSDASKSE